MRELLARLDRAATLSRGHRAGLHLDDRALFDQYIAILVAWEHGALDLPSHPSRPAVDPALDRNRAAGG